MPVTIQPVNASDTINQGRTKFNANDDALGDLVNSLESQQEAHETAWHPSINYTKSEVDALQAAQDAATASAIDTALDEFQVQPENIPAAGIPAGKLKGSGTDKALDNSSIGLNANDEVELKDNGVTTQKILNNAVTTEKLEYKEYVAILNQSGTGAPAVTVLKNTLGFTPVWSRSAQGRYRMSGTYPESKTWGVINGGYETGHAYFLNDMEYGAWQSTRMQVTSMDYNHAYSDNVLSNAMLIVRIYP